MLKILNFFRNRFKRNKSETFKIRLQFYSITTKFNCFCFNEFQKNERAKYNFVSKNKSIERGKGCIEEY